MFHGHYSARQSNPGIQAALYCGGTHLLVINFRIQASGFSKGVPEIPEDKNR